MAEKILRYDFDVLSEDGSDNLTQTLRDLLNEYPFLSSRDIIEFQVLDTTKGIAMFPNPSVATLPQIAWTTSNAGIVHLQNSTGETVNIDAVSKHLYFYILPMM